MSQTVAHTAGPPPLTPASPRGCCGSSAAQPLLSAGSASPIPADALTMQELNFIMKAVQSLIGEFPSMELGGVAERPEALRKWRFATTTALEAAGPHVTTWWDSCWTLAEAAHSLYLQAPVMNREGLKVAKPPNQRYAQLEAWLKPRFAAAMLQSVRRQHTARGVQGMLDEASNDWFMLFK